MKYLNLSKIALWAFIMLPMFTLAQTLNIPNGAGPTITNILGGTLTDITQAPYQVSIERNGNHWCGGSIINERWVLTAAHCLNGQVASSITVHAGSTDQTNNAVGQRIAAQTLFVHPSYSSLTLENDIALIFLAQPLSFNHSVVPIEYANTCNTTTNDVSPGTSVFLTGWGITCNTCPGAANLQGLDIPMISRANAMTINQNHNSSYTLNISGNMLPFSNPGTGAGPGDSGGPAIISKNGNQINLGASSWGYWPKDVLPTVYTNIRNYQTWIENTTGFSISATGVDLYTKDKPWDMGNEPSNVTHLWESEDIWVRKQNDGIEEHQNPEYYGVAGNYNYVYVRVRNRGCTASSGGEKLKLYWAKAATSLSWPAHWNGSLSVSGKPLGDIVGTVTLPAIQPGDAHVAVFQWRPPNPADYVGLASNPIFWADEPHHFCLLSRVEAATDPMTTPETSNLGANVSNNNNIAWKNLTVVDLDPANIAGGGENKLLGAAVLVGDVFGKGGTYDFEFRNPTAYTGNPITTEARVYVTLDDPIWKKWAEGGFKSENIKVVSEGKLKRIQITKSPAKIYNLKFKPKEHGLIHTGFQMITEKISGKGSFTFEVVQRDSRSNRSLGGERFQVKLPKPKIKVVVENKGTRQEMLVAKVTGGSKKYHYLWSTANNPGWSTKESLSPCGINKYLLTVTDQVTKLATTISYYFQAKNPCKKTSVDEDIKKRKSLLKPGSSSIYPNPAKDYLNIQTLRDEQILAIQILNSQGKVFKQLKGNRLSLQKLSLLGLPAGLYLVKITTNKGSMQHKFYVK